MWRATEERKTAVTGAYFSEIFARTKRLDPLGRTLSRIFRGSDRRSMDEVIDNARRFLGVKKVEADV